MTIEIHNPELERLLKQRLEAAGFVDTEDLLLHVLKGNEASGGGSGSGSEKAEEFEAWAD